MSVGVSYQSAQPSTCHGGSIAESRIGVKRQRFDGLSLTFLVFYIIIKKIYKQLIKENMGKTQEPLS